MEKLLRRSVRRERKLANKRGASPGGVVERGRHTRSSSASRRVPLSLCARTHTYTYTPCLPPSCWPPARTSCWRTCTSWSGRCEEEWRERVERRRKERNKKKKKKKKKAPRSLYSKGPGARPRGRPFPLCTHAAWRLVVMKARSPRGATTPSLFLLFFVDRRRSRPLLSPSLRQPHHHFFHSRPVRPQHTPDLRPGDHLPDRGLHRLRVCPQGPGRLPVHERPDPQARGRRRRRRGRGHPRGAGVGRRPLGREGRRPPVLARLRLLARRHRAGAGGAGGGGGGGAGADGAGRERLREQGQQRTAHEPGVMMDGKWGTDGWGCACVRARAPCL